MPNLPPRFDPYKNKHSEKRRKVLVDMARSNDPARTWYNSPEWKARRRLFLRANPFCIDCGNRGLSVKATHADHSPPHGGVWERFIHGPLEPRCAPCHNAKTAREDGGFGNPKRRSSST